MAKSDIVGNADEALTTEDGHNWEWIVAKSLLDANAHSTRAFEQHLLHTCYDDISGDSDEMRRHIEQAIDQHEQIIEQLELAAQAVDDIELGN